ncbi:MAG: T9SS type A sorting domain-containing protein, partial [Ignavibacteriaceae bacterium]|nr:T9SS type A sorting domain-containing protein [Ignavibacteriaceae bacterium]
LWIGFEALSGRQGAHSWAGCDAGPNDPDGQYIYFSHAWYKLTALGAAFTYNWNIRAIIETVSDVQYEKPSAVFALAQNYPNPFNPNTAISFSLFRNSWTSLKVYNIIGQEVSVLLNGPLTAGFHSLNFNAANLPGGIYFYRLMARGIDGESFSSVKKMILLK